MPWSRPVYDDTVALPDGWRSEANGWPSPEQIDYWKVTRSITGLVAGTGEGSLTWGLSIDGGPMEPHTVVMVAEVVLARHRSLVHLYPRPQPPMAGPIRAPQSLSPCCRWR